jgi:hypothetical protein
MVVSTARASISRSSGCAQVGTQRTRRVPRAHRVEPSSRVCANSTWWPMQFLPRARKFLVHRMTSASAAIEWQYVQRKGSVAPSAQVSHNGHLQAPHWCPVATTPSTPTHTAQLAHRMLADAMRGLPQEHCVRRLLDACDPLAGSDTDPATRRLPVLSQDLFRGRIDSGCSESRAGPFPRLGWEGGGDMRAYVGHWGRSLDHLETCRRVRAAMPPGPGPAAAGSAPDPGSGRCTGLGVSGH